MINILENRESKHAPMTSLVTLTVLLLGACLLNACATHVEVSGTFPKPLSKQYPYTITLVFSEAFRNYRFENFEPREVSVAVGNTQVQLFQAVSNSLFKSTDISNSMPENPHNDLTLVLTVADVQISMPYETQLKVFEVWIKYRLELFDNKGELISEWTMPAYGKTPTRFLKSESEALNQAAIVALRDAGANLITGFEKVPAVKTWLAAQTPSTTPPGTAMSGTAMSGTTTANTAPMP